MRGVISKLEKRTSNNNKSYYLLTINGVVYSYWYELNYNVNDTVDFEYLTKEINGKSYNTITNFNEIQNTNDNSSTQIMRLESCKIAKDLTPMLLPTFEGSEEYEKKYFETARKIYEFIMQ